ncbi:MAG: DVU_1555 family C-GCAxxG-C-C protein [Clostridiaceae bacterium]
MDDTAFRIFKLSSQGFCCTQTLIKMVLEDEDKENIDLIKAVHGLCGGIAYTKKACGLLTGGILVLGLYAGKGKAGEPCSDDYMTMMKEYNTWFEEEFGSTDCQDLVGAQEIRDEKGNINYPVKCGETLTKCYIKVQQILMEHDYDYGDRD